MEMVFMAHLAQFRNKIYVILVGVFFVFFFGKCEEKSRAEKSKTSESISKKFNAKNTPILQKNGFAYFQNQIFTGTLYTLNDLGDTLALCTYLEGKEHNIWKLFYEKNKLKEIRFFEKGRKIGKMESFWENGQKKTECFFENDEYEGTYKTWSKNGNLVSEMNYHKGHEEGSQKIWYDNGKIKANYIIKQGRRFGLLGTKNCENVVKN